jgi:hypothetical protein
MTKEEAMQYLKDSLKRWTIFASEKKFENIPTVDGKTLCIEDGKDLAAGSPIYLLDENGNQNPVPAGHYDLQDGRSIEVAEDSTVQTISDAPVADESTPEAEADVPMSADDSVDGEDVNPEEDDMSKRMEALEAQLSEIMEYVHGLSNLQETAMKNLTDKFSKFSDSPAVKSIKNTPVVVTKLNSTLRSSARNSVNKGDVQEIVDLSKIFRNKGARFN